MQQNLGRIPLFGGQRVAVPGLDGAAVVLKPGIGCDAVYMDVAGGAVELKCSETRASFADAAQRRATSFGIGMVVRQHMGRRW